MIDTAQTYALRNGCEVLVRPIGPDDKQRLQEGLQRLSPQSRYQRFMSAPSRLSGKDLEYLTEVDQVDHIAWVAVDPSRPEEPGLAVARCIRVDDDPTAGEIAVTVLDSHQGLGLGTLLLRILCMAAVKQGFRTFRAYVLSTNRPMLKILEQLGARVVRREGAANWLEVPVSSQDLPDTPTGRVFKALADSPQFA